MALVVGMAACGRSGFDRLGSDGGAASDGAASGCTPWGPPTSLAGLQTTGNDWEPALSPDGNMLVFARASAVLMAATRTGDTFGAPVVLASLDAAGAEDVGPAWLPGGTELYFTSNRLVNAEYRLWQSSFSGGTFQAPSQVAELASTDVFSPTVRSDGLEMYFGNAGGGPFEIVRAVRASLAAPWTIDGAQSQLTLGGSAGWPSLSFDGLTLYYELSSAAGEHIYMATRATQDDLFGSAAIVSELATDARDGDPEISDDGTALYFASDPAGSSNAFDLFVSRRTCAKAAP
jgi:Tol biopolymer transport system component